MVKPLRSDDPTPQSMQFSHFGVLNDGSQSKASLFTSITVNILIAFVVVVIGAAAKHTIDRSKKLTSVSLEPMKKPEPEVKPLKPKVLPKLPPVAKVEPPKIKLPDVKLPDLPKPPEVKMTQPMPVIAPAPPKLVQAPPAPKVVSLAQAQPASVMNNNHPAAVSLGQANNPIAPSNRPSTTAVNLGNRGMAGMPASNNGMGARAVSLGSGSPSSQNMAATGPRAVQGVKLGVTGGTGPLNSTGRVAGPVNLGQNIQPAMPHPTAVSATARSAPKVLYKPRPEYTAEATRLHIEGVVSVRIHVTATGAVQVLGVTSDLGYGLGQSAIRAVSGTRFAPATDATGRPTDWEGVVNVAFQLAS
ncbi:MAG: TonB family protein [Acidobacteriota bacterium]|nr:TonB family protein [Acidobacteriota bacterium]